MKVYLFNLQISNKYHHPKMIRERSFHYEDGAIFDNPEKIYKLAIQALHMDRRAEEYVYALCLDTIMQCIGIFEISHGTVNCSVFSPREVLIRALLCGTGRIIILHNHPSGNPKPSMEDIRVTERMKEACQLIGIPFSIMNGFLEGIAFQWKSTVRKDSLYQTGKEVAKITKGMAKSGIKGIRPNEQTTNHK